MFEEFILSFYHLACDLPKI